jgi:hypothetical protein
MVQSVSGSMVVACGSIMNLNQKKILNDAKPQFVQSFHDPLRLRGPPPPAIHMLYPLGW